jgi:hypothetical protein
MYFNVFCLASISFAFIWMLGRRRGWLVVSDAFFPLTLLHWGHCANLLAGWQVQFVLSTGLVSALILIAMVPQPWRWRHVWLACMSVLLLPLCGANGLGFTPLFALWLSYCGHRLALSNPLPYAKAMSMALKSTSALSVLLIAVYFAGFRSPPGPPPVDLGTFLANGLAFAGVGFGLLQHTTGRLFGFPIGPHGDNLVWGAAVAGLTAGTVALLVRTWNKSPAERVTTSGILACLGGVMAIAAGVAWTARLGSSGNHLQLRYVMLAMPLLWCSYITWSMYGGRFLSRFIPVVMFAVGLLMLPLNCVEGLAYAGQLRACYQALEHEIVAGAPPVLLAERFTREPCAIGLSGFREQMPRQLIMLRHAGIGYFRQIKEEPD